jgi:hypothetical protein
MKLYFHIMNLASNMQKAGNMELYRQLIDLSVQVFEMEQENIRLSVRIIGIQKLKDLESRVVRHDKVYVTIQGDSKSVKYCSHCWDSERKLIQIDARDNQYSICPHCKYYGYL